MNPLTLHIEGMSCGHCLSAVQKALGAIDGVTIDSVTIGRATVMYDPERVTPEMVADRVTKSGYPARAST